MGIGVFCWLPVAGMSGSFGFGVCFCFLFGFVFVLLCGMTKSGGGWFLFA